jgi:hypothetical protein
MKYQSPPGVIGGILLSAMVWNASFAQSPPQFLDCSTEPVSLCVNDEGVRLSASNQIFLGEEHPDATSCTVHVTQKTRVKSDCAGLLEYEVLLFLDDTGVAYVLQPSTTIQTDTFSEAELIFDTEISPESFIQKEGLPYTSGCMPFHRVRWIVRDECGNESVCEWRLNVYDGKEPDINRLSYPTVVLFNHSSIITLWAVDFSGLDTDDCTLADDLLYSFSEHIFQPDSTVDCQKIHGFSVPTTIRIWVADSGTDKNCDHFISWNERNITSLLADIIYIDSGGHLECGYDTSYLNIDGVIATSKSVSISNVQVNLEITGQSFPTFITGVNGLYHFLIYDIPTQGSIKAGRNDNHKLGVTTLDLVKIQRHLLGIKPLDNPFDLIAADATNSNSVSTIDLIEIRKVIVGLNAEFPNGQKSWRFFDKKFFNADTTLPWSLREYIEFDTDTSVYDADFIGVKIGDVNHSADPNLTSLLPRQSHPTFPIHMTTQSYQTGEIVEIDFKIPFNEPVLGFQFTLSNPDLEFLDVISDGLHISDEDFALFGDQLTMSWFDIETISLEPDEVWFTIIARAKHKGQLHHRLSLNSTIAETELYTEQEDIFIPQLVFDAKSDDVLAVFTPEPNPWISSCEIPFYTPRDGEIAFSVFDQAGRMIFSEKKLYGKGYQRLFRNENELQAYGVLYYTLQNDDTTLTGKMVRME